MEQPVSLITLGVDDLDRAVAFYEQLGWRGRTTAETTFFQAGGIVAVLWGRAALAADCGLPVGDAGAGAVGGRADGDRPFGGMALAHNVGSRAEVDDLLEAAARAGAVVSRPAAETFYGGYAGVFRDLDGHC